MCTNVATQNFVSHNAFCIKHSCEWLEYHILNLNDGNIIMCCVVLSGGGGVRSQYRDERDVESGALSQCLSGAVTPASTAGQRGTDSCQSNSCRCMTTQTQISKSSQSVCVWGFCVCVECKLWFVWDQFPLRLLSADRWRAGTRVMMMWMRLSALFCLDCWSGEIPSGTVTRLFVGLVEGQRAAAR